MAKSAPVARSLDIAEVLRDARLGPARLLREEPSTYDSLFETTNRLFDLLQERGIAFVLVGGLAVLYHLPGRPTGDIDLVVAAKDLQRVPEMAATSRSGNFVRCDFEGVTVDALLTRDRLFRLISARHAEDVTISGRSLRCATPYGLVLMKLYALPSLYRRGNFDRIRLYRSDVAGLMQRYRPETASVLADLGPHVSATDLLEVHRIVQELAAEIAAFEAHPFGVSRPGEPAPD